jgi:ABC-type Fe3+/spermidine/putrescine transport system ATPase subunit
VLSASDTALSRHRIGARAAAGARVAGRRLEVANAWMAYDAGPYVVKDICFTLEPGEFLTLLGPSGSGKTTTLMMVAGFELPTRGEIRVDGRDVARLPPERRNFGVVFQGYALFPHLTVLENVEFALRMRRIARRDCQRLSMEMLDKVGLSAFAKRRPRELSGGQQQRVALARALVFEPDALLLDEPLGALDKRLREALQVEIKEIQRRIGISVLFVTHDQAEAMMMSDRIAVMRNGRIVQLGSPTEVYQHPRTPFVASFLGETNLIAAVECQSGGPVTQVRFADGTLGLAEEPRDGRTGLPDGRVLLSLRPERIHLLAPEARADTITLGLVVERTFLGNQIRYIVDALGQKLIVSTTELRLASRIGPGDTVTLGWDRDEAQLLAASDENDQSEAAGRSGQAP